MNDLFRKEAVESFSSNLGIAKGVRAINIKTIIFVVFLTICVMIFTTWLVFGTIYESVSVGGIIGASQNAGAVHAVSDGIISKVTVSSGNIVKAGDILAFIPQKEILSKIETEKQKGVSGEEYKKLYDEYEKNSIVRSNIDGVVTYIANENSYIVKGNKIASVVPYDERRNNKMLNAFIPADEGELITIGMEVRVMPDFAPSEEYGYINAYVSEISSYPISGQSIKETKGELFLSTLDERESYLQVEIMLLPDASASSHLKWSNPKGSDIEVMMGTICKADIIIKKCHPFEWLF